MKSGWETCFDGLRRWVRSRLARLAGADAAWPVPGRRFSGAVTGVSGAVLISMACMLPTAVAVVVAGSDAAGAAEAVYKLDDPTKITRLRVTIDKSETIRINRPFAEALVGNDEVADVIPLTDQSLYVMGKKIGATRLSILDADKRLLGVVEVEVAYDVAGIRAHIQQGLPRAKIGVKAMNGRIVLTGTVADAVALEKAVSIAQQFAPKAVTNALSVASPQQVMLEVRFVEASRTAARDLGVNWEALSRTAGNFSAITNFPGVIGEGAFPSNNAPFGAVIARLLSGGTTADLIVQALEERGLARRLAEPNLVALSGDTASFLAGGEFPFPVARDDDTISIEFKKFGVGLAFTPTVLSGGLINLKIEPEVSEIDPNNTLEINGTTIPGLVARRAKTTIELRDGQSFAIAGLLQTDHTKAQRQFPWIGRVPVLGALFRSASYAKRETDLVIIVTPRLVQPAAPGQKLVTPFDKAVAGNDLDFFVKGKQEVSKARLRRKRAKKHGLVTQGHILRNTGAPAAPAAAAPRYTGSIRRKGAGAFETDMHGGA
ncbi:MAG: type II and III secretion system protein family protein [Hyphomicrobiales bacterium]|nr:type II and III secretion system protein family protein [Hyphomicrobiales bacterium]